MSFAGKMLRGLATGAAGYYSEVAKSELEERRSQILAAREQALANINHANRVEEIRLGGEENRKSHSAATLDDTAKDLALLGPKTDAQVTADRAKIAAKAAADYKLLDAKTRSEITLEQFKAQRALELEGVKQEGEDRRNAADNRTYIDTHPTATVQNERGEVTTSFGAGGTTRTTTLRNSRPLSTKSSDDDDYGGGYTGGIAPARPAAPSAPVAADIAPGTIVRNDQGQRMKLSPSGKWIPIP